MLHPDLVLGIDGGGSKTVAWLARVASGGESAVLGRGAAGGCNIQAQGAKASLQNLGAAIDFAFGDAGLPRGQVAAAVAALAGSHRDENRQSFELWANEQNVAERFRVTHDAEPVLAAGTPKGWGVALIAGTGSFAFARAPDGKTARAGGWGYLFGDEGSGYWTAVEGLRAAARAADDRGPGTMLLARLMDRLNATHSLELIPAVYSQAHDRAAIASLAEVVVAAATEGDDVANKIIIRGAAELASVGDAAARAAGLNDDAFPLAVTGGFALRCARLLDLLERELKFRGRSAAPLTRVADPVAGAVLLAAREARGGRSRAP